MNKKSKTHNEKWHDAIDKRTREKQKKILEALEIRPNFSWACKKAGVPRSTANTWQRQDNKFKEQVKEAKKEGVEARMDWVENKHDQKIDEGDWRAIKFDLERRHPAYQSKPIDDRDRNRKKEEAEYRFNTLKFTVDAAKYIGLLGDDRQQEKEAVLEMISASMGIDLSKLREFFNMTPEELMEDDRKNEAKNS